MTAAPPSAGLGSDLGAKTKAPLCFCILMECVSWWFARRWCSTKVGHIASICKSGKLPHLSDKETATLLWVGEMVGRLGDHRGRTGLYYVTRGGTVAADVNV